MLFEYFRAYEDTQLLYDNDRPLWDTSVSGFHGKYGNETAGEGYRFRSLSVSPQRPAPHSREAITTPNISRLLYAPITRSSIASLRF